MFKMTELTQKINVKKKKKFFEALKSLLEIFLKMKKPLAVNRHRKAGKGNAKKKYNFLMHL